MCPSKAALGSRSEAGGVEGGGGCQRSLREVVDEGRATWGLSLSISRYLSLSPSLSLTVSRRGVWRDQRISLARRGCLVFVWLSCIC